MNNKMRTYGKRKVSVIREGEDSVTVIEKPLKGNTFTIKLNIKTHDCYFRCKLIYVVAQSENKIYVYKSVYGKKYRDDCRVDNILKSLFQLIENINFVVI